MDTDTDSNLPAIYEHKKRPEWGASILAWEQDGKRAFLFEDGALRILAQEFCSLMTEVDRPRDEMDDLFQRLQAQLDATDGRYGQLSGSSSSEPDVTFDDQLSVFDYEYPEGFRGEKWLETLRGEDVGKRLKRHRDAAVEDAQAKLSKKELDARIAQKQFRAVWRDALSVAKATDLVPAAHCKGLDIDDPDALRDLAVSLRDMLYGGGRYSEEIDGFVSAHEKAFGKPPSWQLTTVFLGLVHPDTHVCIRPSSFRSQAAWMAPRLTVGNTPSASVYTRLQGMTKLVREKLIDDMQEPKDMVDVHDFIRLTTRPQAAKILSKLRAKAAAQGGKPKKKGAQEAA